MYNLFSFIDKPNLFIMGFGGDQLEVIHLVRKQNFL